ncbi:Endonuclease/exonuclease/phosphatase [Apodospora peruviana]|uniref:Endonuclease/exonuclease/phosphatase n=1 Tax=Apodospora peruviana TaxID=516989 RepID=A0AAE0IPA1_9PEZI|nr:Endonuclease/exonuclease/phosphatase [Apodospora peruviana]
MDELPTEISVLTLNCWGLKYISKLRRERISEIGRQLSIASPQPHIVALQELFTQEDYWAIRRQTRFILPYGKFYHSAALGGGLAILSRWPIQESTMLRYPLNGRPTAFWRGDWYVGKGVACARIRYGPDPKHVIEVFNTHTHAPYEGGQPDDSYLCHRMAQSWEIAKLMRGAAERGHLVLGMGDFNMIPLSPEHRIITAHAPVVDAWRVLHPDSSVGPATHPAEQARHRPIPTAEFNIVENGAASDGPTNTWRWSSKQQKLLGIGKPEVTVPPDTIDHRGKRLDYVFASSGEIPTLGGSWTVRRVSVGMMMRHPQLGCSLSDHFAVEAVLAFESTAAEPTKIWPPTPKAAAATVTEKRDITSENDTIIAEDNINLRDSLHNGTYLQSPTSSSFHEDSASKKNRASFDHQQQQQKHYYKLPESDYTALLDLIHTYALREQRQLKYRGLHFFVALFVTIASLVGVWFIGDRTYVGFILILVSSLGLTAGTVDGLMALLFFKAELRALKEFEWEVRNARAFAGAAVRGDGMLADVVPVRLEDEDSDDD